MSGYLGTSQALCDSPPECYLGPCSEIVPKIILIILIILISSEGIHHWGHANLLLD